MSRPGGDNWLDRLRAAESANPWLRAILVAFLVAAFALIIAPQDAQRGNTLTPLDTENGIASTDVLATHAFRFERSDPAGVRAVREAAAAQVVPVWDYDASLEELVDQRIEEAFSDLRTQLIAAGSQLRTAEPAVPDAAEGSADADGSGAVAVALPALSDEELIALVPEEARMALIPTSMAAQALREGAREPDAVDLKPFARAGFSRQVQDALQALVAEAMTKHIVEDVSALESIGIGGVTLRTLRDGSPESERRIRQLISFGDIGQLASVMAPARHHLFYIDAELRDAIEALATALVRVNTQYNPNETSSRIEAAARDAETQFRDTLVRDFRRGEIIVSQGQEVGPRVLAIVAQMEATAPPSRSRAYVLLATALLIVLLLLPIMRFALGNMARFTHDSKDLAMMAAVMLAQLTITRVGIFLSDVVGLQGEIPAEALYLLIPFAAGAMIVRILTNAENAMVFAVLYALFAGVLFRFDVTYATTALVGSVVGIVSVRGAQTRTDILRASVLVGGVVLGVAVAFAVLSDPMSEQRYTWIVVGGLMSGVTSALFVYALLPIIEATFRFTTPMRLMELANLNHPALKELILKAPGSYHHSMMVGQLVEAGCEAIKADALLGRVGSYFHDIGKTKTPHYFAENQKGVNPHDKLKPNMSALVIKSHVKDGVELAKQYKLPPEIIDFIREHHGTSLIQYFYMRAQEQDDGAVNESDYRYPGPRPQSRETAICMLADGIEAASRALPDPSHSHLKGLVQKMINKAFIDGQLDECDLTLKDLDLIANAFLLRLTAFYHHRPEYPDARKSQTSRRNRRGDSSDNEAVKEEVIDGADDSTGGPPVDASGASRATPTDDDINLRRLGM